MNDDLAAAGCQYIASTGVLPAQLGAADFQTAQHYYAVLKGLQEQQSGGQAGQENQDEPAQGGNGQTDQQRGGSHETRGQSAGDGGRGEQGKAFAGCGSGSGGQRAPGELAEADDLAGRAPAASPGERARLRVSTAAQIVEHAARGRGTVPAGLVEQAELILAPSTTPWQRLVGAAVRRVVRRRAGQERTDYTRRDRRRHNVTIGDRGAKVVFPGRSSPKLRIVVVRDTSGSMSAQELDVVTSEIIAISRRLRIKGKDLIVLDVDADVHATRGFTGAAGLRDVHGRGGTDMRVGIDTALATPGGVDLVVVLTDGGTPWPTDRTRVPVIACLVGPWAPRTEQDVPDWIARIVVTDPADQG